MQRIKLSAVLVILLVGLVACNKGDSSSSAGSSTSNAGGGEMIKFVTTQDGSPLTIDAALFDTPAAKEFLATGKNPYIGNAEAVATGKKIFGFYSCTQCHGSEAAGQAGLPKGVTNKGMFETIWHGTNGGMGGKGMGIMDPTNPANGMTVDETLKVIAWIRSHGGVTGNE